MKNVQEVKDKSVQAYALRLPDSSTLAEEMDVIDPDALHEAIRCVSVVMFPCYLMGHAGDGASGVSEQKSSVVYN